MSTPAVTSPTTRSARMLRIGSATGPFDHDSSPRVMSSFCPYALYCPATCSWPLAVISRPGCERTRMRPPRPPSRPKPLRRTSSPSTRVRSSSSGVAARRLRILRIEHDHVRRSRHALVEALQVDPRRRHRHRAGDLQRLRRRRNAPGCRGWRRHAGRVCRRPARSARAAFSSSGVSAFCQLSEPSTLSVPSPERTWPAMRALPSGRASRRTSPSSQHDRQRRQFGGELRQSRLSAELRLRARAGQRDAPIEPALGLDDVRREQFHPHQLVGIERRPRRRSARSRPSRW